MSVLFSINCYSLANPADLQGGISTKLQQTAGNALAAHFPRARIQRGKHFTRQMNINKASVEEIEGYFGFKR